MHESSIQVKIQLDEQKIPQSIDWSATDSTAQEAQAARAMMLTFWDPTDKTALRIDLWTKDMMVDEMGDFYYQMFMTMAEAFKRSTNQDALSEDIKKFAQEFFNKFRTEMINNQ